MDRTGQGRRSQVFYSDYTQKRHLFACKLMAVLYAGLTKGSDTFKAGGSALPARPAGRTQCCAQRRQNPAFELVAQRGLAGPIRRQDCLEEGGGRRHEVHPW